MSHEVINLVAAILTSKSTVPRLIMRSAKNKTASANGRNLTGIFATLLRVTFFKEKMKKTKTKNKKNK